MLRRIFYRFLILGFLLFVTLEAKAMFLPIDYGDFGVSGAYSGSWAVFEFGNDYYYNYIITNESSDYIKEFELSFPGKIPEINNIDSFDNWNYTTWEDSGSWHILWEAEDPSSKIAPYEEGYFGIWTKEANYIEGSAFVYFTSDISDPEVKGPSTVPTPTTLLLLGSGLLLLIGFGGRRHFIKK